MGGTFYLRAERPDGKIQVSGSKELKASQAYTPAFGRAMAQLFKNQQAMKCAACPPLDCGVLRVSLKSALLRKCGLSAFGRQPQMHT